MKRNALSHYPHLVLAQAISGKEGRLADRRAAALAPKTTTLSAQRALFDEAVQAEFAPGAPYPELVKGAFIGEPGGFWVYEYHHIQCRWVGWQAALRIHGYTVTP